MIPLTAGEIGLLLGGDIFCDKDLLVSQAPIFDSRKAIPGSIFLALKGDQFDGHDFAADAYRAGSVNVGDIRACTLRELNCYWYYWITR
jgi:UDP-N-acetylmuramoyl-tripeptide--D-alanyl-D-alanine ligase